MLPLRRVESVARAQQMVTVHVLNTDRGPVACLIGSPGRIPDSWLEIEADRTHDVPAILERADRYSRLEGQPAILIHDADGLWREDWGQLV